MSRPPYETACAKGVMDGPVDKRSRWTSGPVRRAARSSSCRQPRESSDTVYELVLSLPEVGLFDRQSSVLLYAGEQRRASPWRYQTRYDGHLPSSLTPPLPYFPPSILGPRPRFPSANSLVSSKLEPETDRHRASVPRRALPWPSTLIERSRSIQTPFPCFIRPAGRPSVRAFQRPPAQATLGVRRAAPSFPLGRRRRVRRRLDRRAGRGSRSTDPVPRSKRRLGDVQRGRLVDVSKDRAGSRRQHQLGRIHLGPRGLPRGRPVDAGALDAAETEGREEACEC